MLKARSIIERQSEAAALGGLDEDYPKIDARFGRKFRSGVPEGVRVRAYYPPTRSLLTITKYVKSISWTDATDQAAVAAVFEIDNSTGEVGNQLNRPGIIVFVEFKGPDGKFKERLRLVVWESEITDLTQGLLTWNCFDHLLYLQMAKGSFKYGKDKEHPDGWTASEIIYDICQQYRIPVASTTREVKPKKRKGTKSVNTEGLSPEEAEAALEEAAARAAALAEQAATTTVAARSKKSYRIVKTKYRMTFKSSKISVYEAMAHVLAVDAKKTGNNYFIESDKGRLVVRRARRMGANLAIADSHNLRSGTFSRSMTETFASVEPLGTVGETAGLGRGPVLLLGDSLGVGVSTYLDDHTSRQVISRVEGGEPTSWGVGQVNALGEVPSVVVVFLGSNDSNASTFKQSAQNVLDAIGPDKAVFWNTIQNTAASSAINAHLREFASKGLITILDWKAAVKGGKVAMSNDNLHATGAGYNSWAREVGRAIKPNGGKPKSSKDDDAKSGDKISKKLTPEQRAKERARRRAAKARAEAKLKEAGMRGVPTGKKSNEEDFLASSMLFGAMKYRGYSNRGGVKDPDWHRKDAQATANRLARATKTLSVQADGNIHIRQGDLIYVVMPLSVAKSGEPKRLRKAVYVSSVTHSFAAGDYTMDVECAWREKEVAVKDPNPPAPRQGGNKGGSDGEETGDFDGIQRFTKEQLVELAKSAGFPDPNTAAAVAMAESQGDPKANGDTSLAPLGSRGLWQIYTKAHPQYDPERLYEPTYNAKCAVEVFRGAGNSFQPWTMYTNGVYRQYL